MSSLETLMLRFLEVGSFMLLWNMFNKNYEKRLLKSLLVVIFTSLAALFTNYIYDLAQFFINYLILFLAIKWMFKKKTRYSLLEFGLVLSVLGVMQLAVIIILRTGTASILMKDSFLYYFIANLICAALSFCTYRYVSYGRLAVLFKQESAKIYFFSINLLIYIVTAKWAWSFKRHEFIDEISLYLVIPLVFILVNLFFLEHNMKQNELKKSLEDYKKYSPVISDLLEDVRRRQHDFKNHLNTVYSLVLVSDEKSLKETIGRYMDSLNTSLENMEKVLQIDNTVVTAVIYNKINEASKYNLEFKYVIQGGGQVPLKDYELSEVLNNLLDNAFEAVLDSEGAHKRVFLNIGPLEDAYVIEIGNTGKRIEFSDIGKVFEAGYTTKTGENRGYGLYNVKKIVESYGGRIQLSFENNYTIFNIKL